MKLGFERKVLCVSLSAALTLGCAVPYFAAEGLGTELKTETETGIETGIETETGAEIETEIETEEETEEVYEKAKVMFAVDDVYVRQEADYDSEAVAIAHRGEAFTVIGKLGIWYHIRLDDPEIPTEGETETETELLSGQEESPKNESEPIYPEGYVKGDYVTEVPEEAELAVKAQENALAAQAAAAQAAAAQAAAAKAAASQAPQKPAGNQKKELSRVAVDDCDGSGHGYYLISYSDGSTATEDY